MKFIFVILTTLPLLLLSTLSIADQTCPETASIYECKDKNIHLEGRVSEVIWQHLMGTFKNYPASNYFDYTRGKDSSQTVVYSQFEITCKTKVSIDGKVVEIVGHSKGKGSENGKPFTEYGVLAYKWTCEK